MTKYEWAKERLSELSKLSAEEQRTRQVEIDDAFPHFLAGKPSKAEFVATCGGLLFTAGMLWEIGSWFH